MAEGWEALDGARADAAAAEAKATVLAEEKSAWEAKLADAEGARDEATARCEAAEAAAKEAEAKAVEKTAELERLQEAEKKLNALKALMG